MKQFVANVTMQVVERHIVADLDEIFTSPLVSDLSDSEVQNIASEGKSAMNQRAFLEAQIESLEDGQAIFKSVM